METSNIDLTKRRLGPQSRSFSTKFEDHEPLLHTMTRKCFGRLVQMNPSADYEDLFQELCVAFVRAQKTYDPTKGISFTAYMGRAVYNEFNGMMDKIARDNEAIPMISAQELEARGDDGDIDFYGTYDPKQATMEDLIVRSDEARDNFMKLSYPARLVVKELHKPSKELLKAHSGMLAHSALARAKGENVPRVSHEITLRVVAQYLHIDKKTLASIRQEFREVVGVDV
jgi:DNA-directed RNA polymerase specialized sigma24 family protein